MGGKRRQDGENNDHGRKVRDTNERSRRFLIIMSCVGVVLIVFLSAFSIYRTDSATPDKQDVPFRARKLLHEAARLSTPQVRSLANLTDIENLNELLDNICVIRVVGTSGHARVKEFIKDRMADLGWHVEADSFVDKTPIFGNLKFENIIAKLNPNAHRFLVLACHYDSKFTPDFHFEGATDSAVPCAQMINLATVMQEHLNSVKNRNDVSLMMLFLDGEEAFHTWGPKDSIYGARNLASKWEKSQQIVGREYISELEKIDLFVLLDLIGAPDPRFYNYFRETTKWYSQLARAETLLADMRLFNGYSYGKPHHKYFQEFTIGAGIQDDHLPFLERRVPILHLIPQPFPDSWHTTHDNRDNLSMTTIENINKILRVFVAAYLRIPV